MGTWRDDFVAQGMELRETHISLVFLTHDRAYKVKKAVDLGFLDFTALSERKRLCEAEVLLNRRLAEGVYLGVVPIGVDAHGVHHLGADGEAVEWAVEMVRLDDRDAADQRLVDGRLGADDVERIARHLVAFHARAEAGPRAAELGGIAALERNVRENFEQTRQNALAFLSPPQLAEIQRFQLEFLRDQRAVLEARLASGRVRDGHGDLRLEHCYVDDDGAIAIIDCIEFNERFRYGDVCTDLAFLSMDLEHHGRHDLAELLLGGYAHEAGDFDLYAVVDFYESYRAYVRGKISSIVAEDPAAPLHVRTRARSEARKYYLLADACAREPLARPCLFAVGGMIAAGKSTVARMLARAAFAPVIEADRTRKELAGVQPTTPLQDGAFAEHYSARASERTYGELLRRAEIVLRSGRSAVLDASFRSRAHRAQTRELADRLGVELRFVECVADEAVCRARLVQRRLGASVSDGREEIFDAFARSYEPMDELPATSHVRLDTGTGPAQVAAKITALVGV